MPEQLPDWFLPVAVAITAILILGLLVWLGLRKKTAESENTRLQGELHALQTQYSELHEERRLLEQAKLQLEAGQISQQQQLDQINRLWQEEKESASRLQQDNTGLREQVAHLKTALDEQAKQAEEKLAMLREAKAQLTAEFKNLANDIFEDKSKRFTEQNKTNLDTLLKPLSGQLQDFQKRVEETYDKESKERFSLVKEIKSLQELNSRISDDAVSLTNALKGDNKTQGSWGELKLERILEASGLEKGVEYDVQVSLKGEEGQRLQPDVLIHLPEHKDVIVDSKMTLKAYHDYVRAEEEGEKEQAAVQHLQSIKNHIKELSSKDYHTIPGLRSLDFVLLFLPIEDAFSLAVQRDQTLFATAFEKNIILVGPSTLLATLRTIHSIWRHEYQSQNAQEIAKRAGDLYDKFVNFVGDLDAVGERIGKVQESYDSARNKLVSGRGNLINRAETLKKLGAKANKQLSRELVSEAENLQLVESPQREKSPQRDESPQLDKSPQRDESPQQDTSSSQEKSPQAANEEA